MPRTATVLPPWTSGAAHTRDGAPPMIEDNAIPLAGSTHGPASAWARSARSASGGTGAPLLSDTPTVEPDSAMTRPLPGPTNPTTTARSTSGSPSARLVAVRATSMAVVARTNAADESISRS